MVFIYASKMHESRNEQNEMRHNLFGEIYTKNAAVKVSFCINMVCAQLTAENGAHVE